MLFVLIRRPGKVSGSDRLHRDQRAQANMCKTTGAKQTGTFMPGDDDDRRVAQEREVDANYRAFKALEAELPHEHDGQYALMRRGKIIGYFPDAVAAYRAGLARYPDRRFSMQEVRAKPLDFGWFSHVSPALFTNPSAD